MTIDKDILWDTLDRLWQSPTVVSMPIRSKRFVLISDIHLGNGKGADDFFQNKKALILALDYYHQAGFYVILLGDVEELWQFDLHDIIGVYDAEIYSRLRKFGKERLLRIFGNHDREWAGILDPSRDDSTSIFFAPEAIKLCDENGKDRFLLVHGHQGSIDADKFSWFSRFWVRAYSGVEPLLRLTGLVGHSSATKSQVAKDYERTFYGWAKEHKAIVICGHSHRAIFASQSYGEKIQEKINDKQLKAQSRGVKRPQKSEYLREIDQLERELEDEKEKGRLIEPVEPDSKPLPCYFNTGCGLYSDGLTAIEIDGDEIRLVKWNKYERAATLREEFNVAKISDLLARLE